MGRKHAVTEAILRITMQSPAGKLSASLSKTIVNDLRVLIGKGGTDVIGSFSNLACTYVFFWWAYYSQIA
jgi:hypothetical protein